MITILNQSRCFELALPLLIYAQADSNAILKDSCYCVIGDLTAYLALYSQTMNPQPRFMHRSKQALHIRFAGSSKCQLVLVGACLAIAANLTSLLSRRVPATGSGIILSRPTHTESRVSYGNTFLDSTSMWGMGVDARTIPPRRKNVPLVSWSKQAVARVRAEWTRVQWSSTCDRTMYVYPHSWGITSQMRDYSDAAFIALAFERPVRVVRGSPKPRWCEEDAWLECFFEPLAGPSCESDRDELMSVKQFRPQVIGNGSALPKARRIFEGPGVLHMAYDARFTFILDDPSYFPWLLWEGMINDNLVYFHDSFDRPINPRHLMASDPHLFQTISVSALRTMLSSLIFRPRPHILADAGIKINEMGNVPCMALHLRWTDKQNDGGIVANLDQYDDHTPAALTRTRRRIGKKPSCVIILTDDDVRAFKMLVAKHWSTYEVKPVSRISAMFGPNLTAYDTYARMGHNYFARLASSPVPGDRGSAFHYFQSTIVDAIVASRAANMLIGMGSSGLSQLVSQYMGFYRHVDCNAFAIWQEDVVNSA